MGRRGRKGGNNFTEGEEFLIQPLHSLYRMPMPRMALKKKRETGRGERTEDEKEKEK
jgi:hypothetical protein